MSTPPAAEAAALPPGDVSLPSERLLATLRPVVRTLVNTWYDVHQHGLEHIPDGPVIVASNHLGLLDGPLLAAYFPRPVHALTKKEMFDTTLGPFLRSVGQIPLARYEVDSAAIRACSGVLRRGGVVGIYPEGARGAGDLARIHNGVAYLGLVAGAPILPLAVFGTREPGGGMNSTPKRGARFDFVYGPPVYLTPTPWPRRQREVRAAASTVLKHLRRHLDQAMTSTGRELPGNLPEADRRQVEAEIRGTSKGMTDA